MPTADFRPGLIATDLDGTLLRQDGTVSARTRAALDAVRATGVPLVLVTGRPLRWMSAVVEATGHTGIAVCANGALVCHLGSGRVLTYSPIHLMAALGFAEAMHRALPSASFATEGPDGVFSHEPAYRTRFPPTHPRTCSRPALFDTPAVKMLVRHPDLNADQLLKVAEGLLGERPLTLTHSSTEGLLEISAGHVTKATAVAGLAAQWGVATSAVLAFGDMPNDVPLLRWAGYSVAVAGAHPSVLEVVDEVTLSNDTDGVAVVLERYLTQLALPA